MGSPPISRVLSWATIPLGPPLPTASSSLPGSDAGHANAPLFGLAPNEVCRAVPVTRNAVGSYPKAAFAALTHLAARHHFTLTGPLFSIIAASCSSEKDFAALTGVKVELGRYLSVALSVALGRSTCVLRLIAPGRKPAFRPAGPGLSSRCLRIQR